MEGKNWLYEQSEWRDGGGQTWLARPCLKHVVNWREGSMQELGKKFKRTLAGNWWVGIVQCRGCGKRGPVLEERREEKKLFGWRLQRMR